MSAEYWAQVSERQTAEIDRLRAELAELRTFLDDDSDDWIREHNAMRARLTTGIALCDVHPTRNRVLAARCDRIRAALMGETK